MPQNGATRRAREKTGAARSPLAIVLDRHLFLHALQFQRPEWWRGFHKSVNLPEPDRLTVEEWADCAGVVDGWFIEVLKDTDTDWRAYPESERAKLVDGREWFTYRGREHDVLPFEPKFENPWPMVMGESQTLETTDQFEERMAEQFRQTMKAYKSYIRPAAASQSEQSLGNRRRDAHLTALAFSGMSPQEIAQIFPGMMDRSPKAKRGQYADPEETIRKAVERFSADIDLTLRSRRFPLISR